MSERYHAKGQGKESKEKYLYCIIKKINEFSVELWQVIVGLITRYENYVCPNSVKSFLDIPFKPKPLLTTPPPIFQVMFPFNEIIRSQTNIIMTRMENKIGIVCHTIVS